ncbi:cell division protein FtsL [Bryocella elongata]
MAVVGNEMERMQARAPRQRRTASVAERNSDLYQAQRRLRRGPTPEMFFAKHIDNSRLVKADDPVRRREMRIFTTAMTLFFALTMIYVWQHLSSIEVGYKVEAQKQQVELLREKNRQLELQDAQLSDPNRLDRLAKQLGLDTPAPGQVILPVNAGKNDAVLAQAQAPVIRAN